MRRLSRYTQISALSGILLRTGAIAATVALITACGGAEDPNPPSQLPGYSGPAVTTNQALPVSNAANNPASAQGAPNQVTQTGTNSPNAGGGTQVPGTMPQENGAPNVATQDLQPTSAGGSDNDPNGDPNNSGDQSPATEDNSDDTTTPVEPPGNDGGYLPPANLTGGASAAFICTPGATYGDPLAGTSTADIQSFGAPQGDFFAFLEGPLWIGSVGTLYFSDNARGPERIYQLVPPSTETTLFKEDAGSNGLAVDANDQLILADQRDNRISRVDPTTAQVTGVLVPNSNVRPNDLVLRSDGHIYFTDPSSGLYHSTPDGTVTGPINAGNSAAPLNSANGVVLSPDERTLYAGSVSNSTVSTFTVLADGSIDAASGALFVTTNGGVVDGMAIDCAGNLYVGTANAVEVFDSAGQAIGSIATGYSSNCTFGGADRQTLYVTSQGTLKAIRLNVPGLPN